LGGCFLSKAPLITPETADYPIETNSHFDAYARRGTDWRPLPEGRTVRRLNGYYYYRNDGSNRTSVPFLMKEISENRYLVQANDTSDFRRVTEFYYFLIDFDGAEAIKYTGTCWPRQDWIDDGIIADVQFTSVNTRCAFETLENLVTVLEATSAYTAPEERFVLTPPAGAGSPN